MPLFERSTRRVRLTSAGEAFAAECSLAFGHLERASIAALEAADGSAGRLRVGYMDFAINGRLPSLLQGFRAKYQRAVLDLEYNPSARRTLRLADLAEEPFVMGTEDAFSTFRRLFFPVCHTAGCARNIGRVGVGVVVKPLADVSDVIPTFAVWVADNPSEVLQRFRDYLVANARLQMAAARAPREQ